MADYGVTLTGFVMKPLIAIKKGIQDDLLSNINSELNLQDASVFGQVIGVFSDPIRQQWEVQQAVYRSAYPDSASGEALDQVSSITGARRPEAQQSNVVLDRLFLEDGTTLNVGDAVSVGTSGARFLITSAITNSSGETRTMSAPAKTEDYGPIQGYAETINEIRTPVSGWSAAAAVSGTVTETFSLDGLGLSLQVDENGTSQAVTFTAGNPWSAADAATAIKAQTTGIDAYDSGLGKLRIASDTEGGISAIEIESGTALTALGLTAALTKGLNSEDAEPGRSIALDPELRIYRLQTLRSGGSGTIEALYAALRALTGVQEVLILENRSPAVSVEGLPPNSYEAIMRGGVAQDIAETIWLKGPAGIEAFGVISNTVVDSAGYNQIIKHSEPTDIAVYLTYTLTTDSSYPADGDALVKAAVVAYANLLNTGDDAVALQFKAVPLTITGVTDVPVFFIGLVPTPSGTSNIAIALRERVEVDTSYIVVT